MVEPISLGIAIGFLVKSAPGWFHSLQDTLLSKGKDFAIEQGKQRITGFIDEKKNLHHMELALKNAAERGLRKFQTLEERDQYRSILEILAEGNSEALRQEVTRIFTLSDNPDLSELTEKYNLRQRISALAQHKTHEEEDAAPYLNSFFEALIAELYNDPLFREQMSDVIKVRAALAGQRSLADILATLNQISDILADNYTAEQFERDVERYRAHLERTLHYLKLVGVVPKDRGDKNADPELNSIFVPLRIAFQEQTHPHVEKLDSILALLEHHPYVVLLGGPGSGKSTAVRHLAWSHAIANQTNSSVSNMRLLSGNPLPLRIELRRLTEARRHHPDYNFLSYATEVFLGREGVEINSQMFKELLERKTMLLLFDGLDEIATLDERKQLIEEIEHFALYYPGNRIVVTSRPVGYELARFSNQWFVHVQVQEFNDEQIREFLERWYTHVLRLLPIPHEDQHELEVLFTTLQQNPRLHKLAENPLLLTVITALHRYERLPDRRVQVYDRCADLLLDTWAKVKGTDVRWQNMKMSRDDQYACIAHLGFVLHERSHESEKDKDIASDVPTRFMLREIEHFLKNQNFFPSVAEQRTQAKHFLELMQLEAGLIVERGTDESGQLLYGFMHRTFQEYFAALDVYERYQQEEDSTIISEFLKEHLHDPHWREVILLLLGKLKRKPATIQLRNILEGKSRLSTYTDIVQQDLFFTCNCLAEEIVVENELAVFIVSHISDLVKNSPFPSQRTEAFEALALLMQTRHYADLGRKELRDLVTQEIIPDIPTRIRAARTLYLSSLPKSEEQQQAVQVLLNLAQRSDISFEESLLAARTLYEHSYAESEELQQAAQMLLDLARRPDISFKQSLLAIEILYWNSPDVSEERQQAIKLLLGLARQPDISFEQVGQITRILYEFSSTNSEERKQASQMLWQLMQRSHLSFEEEMQVAKATYEKRFFYREGQQQAAQVLLHLVQRSDLSFEQTALAAQTLYMYSPKDLQQAVQVLLHLAKRSDLSFEQNLLVTQALYRIFPTRSEKRAQATRMFLDLIQQPDLPVEQTLRAAQTLYQYSPNGSEGRFVATKMLLNLMRQPDLSVEHTLLALQILHKYSSRKPEEEEQPIQVLQHLSQRNGLSAEQAIQSAELLYRSSSAKSEEERQAIKILWQLAQKQNITTDQRLRIATVPLTVKKANYSDRVQAVQMILSLIQGEAAGRYIEEYWQPIEYHNEATVADISFLFELVQQEMLLTGARDQIYQILRNMVPQFDKINSSNT